MIIAMLRELKLQASFLKKEKISTIYFGGGTPSVLTEQELNKFFECLNEHYNWEENVEITLEANPDDLTIESLKILARLGVNRLSIGVQSFDDKILRFMNRSHDAKQALDCIDMARDTGFSNISADLIFAIPHKNYSITTLHSDLVQMVRLSPEHVSLYGLTIESQTVFGKWANQNKLTEVGENENAEQYETAIQFLKESGYEHYEVSNLGLPDFHSKHNSSYWLGEPYLGIGPGAHSFDGESRFINISNNSEYVETLKNNQLATETETLTDIQKLNEYVLTRIRTKWGIDLLHIKGRWNKDFAKNHKALISKLINTHKATLQGDLLILTSEGLSLADEVALHLFSEE